MAATSNDPARDLPADLLERAAEWSAVTGYEWPAQAELAALLPRRAEPRRDAAGNLWVRFGPKEGPPRRVVAAVLDEPGFVVSEITEGGYLRLRSLHRRQPSPLWLQWHEGRKVVVQTRSGQLVGAVAAPSVHLRRGRPAPGPEPLCIEGMWVDVGAAGRTEAEGMGIRLLDPVAYRKRAVALGGDRAAAPGLGSRWGAAVLLELAAHLAARPPSEPVVLVWLGQQSFGRRGEDAAAGRFQGAAEVWILGEDPSGGKVHPASGGGPVQWRRSDEERADLPEGWQEALFEEGDRPGALYTGGPDWGGARVRHFGVPVGYPGTTTEVVSLRDVRAVCRRLADMLGVGSPEAGASLGVTGTLDRSEPGGGPHEPTARVLARLVTTPGVSGHEAPVRAAVAELLPEWAAARLETDEEGNLILALGEGRPGPRFLFVAHMDEIGYEVAGLDEDGRARLRPRGGFLPTVFEAHPVQVVTAAGTRTGIIAPRDGYEAAAVEAVDHSALRLDLGASSAAEAGRMTAEGDPVLPLKEFHRMGPHRASARSFDDRVGCAALVLALRRLGPQRVRHPVTFAWSVREEVGLEGARHLARTLPAPDHVFAVDTFVSADSPLESRRYAWAPLGAGAVVRALDSSNVVPPEVVDSLLELARNSGVPLQYGATGGGNDGAVFTPRGAVDVPISWPMRNSHTPAEVVDLRDVEALADLVRLLALDWMPPASVRS